MTKDQSKPVAASQETSFEEAMSQLESIIEDLEDGSLGLEDSMRRFETGVGLLRACYGILERAEQRIEVLTGFDEQGRPELAPFDATATVDQTGK
jgi:exodeoxyribonuclease VII small subunit